MVPILIEGLADHTDAAVHHVARPNPIETRLRLRHRHPRENGQGGFIVNPPVFGHHTIMAIRAVGIHGHIAHQAALREPLLDTAGDAEVEIVVGPTVGGHLVLQVLLHRREEAEIPDAQVPRPLDLSEQLVLAQPRHPGKAGNGLFDTLTVDAEQRVDQLLGVQPALPCQSANRSVAPVPPWAAGLKRQSDRSPLFHECVRKSALRLSKASFEGRLNFQDLRIGQALWQSGSMIVVVVMPAVVMAFVICWSWPSWSWL